MAIKYMLGSVTQGSADAFAEAEFQTGLSNVTRSAFRVRSIEWYAPHLPGIDCFIQAALKRTSSSSITILTPSNSVISSISRSCELVTSGMTVADYPDRTFYERDYDLLIVEESLFLSVDSNATSLSNTVQCRIGYEVRTITENERLSIQAASAS